MLGNYYVPATSSANNTGTIVSTIYQEQQHGSPARTMDNGHHQEPLGSPPPGAPSSPSRHPVKLSIHSLIDPASASEGGTDADGPSPTRSPRRRPQWENSDDATFGGGGVIEPVAAVDGFSPPGDYSPQRGTEAGAVTGTRPSPSLSVRLTLEEPLVGPVSVPKLRRRRSSINLEHSDDRERRKSLRLSRTGPAVEVAAEGEESLSVAPVVQPQRIRLRSPKRRSPSPRRKSPAGSPQSKKTKPARGNELEEVDVRRSRSPPRKSPGPSVRVKGHLRSRSPRRTSAGTVPSPPLRSSPMKGTRSEPTRSPLKKTSPFRSSATSTETAPTNKIRIRLRPSLEASSAESVGGAGGMTTPGRGDDHDSGADTKRRATPKKRRSLKRPLSRDKNRTHVPTR